MDEVENVIEEVAEELDAVVEANELEATNVPADDSVVTEDEA